MNEPLDKVKSAVNNANDRDMTVSGQFIGYPSIVGPPVANGIQPYPVGPGPGPGPGPYPGDTRIPIGGRYPYFDSVPPGSNNLYPSYDSVRPSYNYGPGSGTISVEICLERSRYLAQHCENALLQSQRFAQYYTTPSEVQRVICCGLFYYRDCMFQVISRVCPGSDPFILGMTLPYTVSQQLATCRVYTRGQCSNSLRQQSVPLINLISLIIIIFSWSFYTNTIR